MRTARRLLWLVCATLLGVGLLAATPAGRADQKPDSGWPPKAFPIGMWCSPPEPYITVEQYKRIAEAGFTMVLPPCEGEATPERNHKILAAAHATGLKVILSDSRMPLAIAGNPQALRNLRSIVNEYHKNSALAGYFLTDEPGANQFAGLAEVVAELHKLDPDHFTYINLFPNYASTNRTAQPSQLNADSYDDYLDRYLQTVKPEVLSWDHYFFLKDGDRPGFFGNLYSGQRASQAAMPEVPFWQIVLSVQHGSYRALNESELRFEAMQTLAYGAHGLLYFTYWPPNDSSFQWSNAIMNRDGTPGPLYEAVKRVNREVKDLSKWLYSARVIRTFQAGTIPPDGRPQPDDIPVKAKAPGDLTIGAFRDYQGYFYALVTNRDYKKGVKAQILADAGSHAIEALDLETNKWTTPTGPKNDDGVTTLTFDLPPSGAALIRWQ